MKGLITVDKLAIYQLGFDFNEVSLESTLEDGSYFCHLDKVTEKYYHALEAFCDALTIDVEIEAVLEATGTDDELSNIIARSNSLRSRMLKARTSSEKKKGMAEYKSIMKDLANEERKAKDPDRKKKVKKALKIVGATVLAIAAAYGIYRGAKFNNTKKASTTTTHVPSPNPPAATATPVVEPRTTVTTNVAETTKPPKAAGSSSHKPRTSSSGGGSGKPKKDPKASPNPPAEVIVPADSEAASKLDAEVRGEPKSTAEVKAAADDLMDAVLNTGAVPNPSLQPYDEDDAEAAMRNILGIDAMAINYPQKSISSYTLADVPSTISNRVGKLLSDMRLNAMRVTGHRLSADEEKYFKTYLTTMGLAGYSGSDMTNRERSVLMSLASDEANAFDKIDEYEEDLGNILSVMFPKIDWEDDNADFMGAIKSIFNF